MAWGEGVAQLVRVHVAESGRAGDTAHDPADVMAVQRATVVGDQQLVRVVAGAPVVEEFDKDGVQWQVAVVAELADWDPQPVIATDAHGRVRLERAQLAGA